MAHAREKKLIQFGWDMKSPAQLAEAIDQLHHLPFDELAIRTAWCYPFHHTGLGNTDSVCEIARNIKWGRFTDNFICMTAGKKVYWGQEHNTWKYAHQKRHGHKTFAEFEVMVQHPRRSRSRNSSDRRG